MAFTAGLCFLLPAASAVTVVIAGGHFAIDIENVMLAIGVIYT